MRLPDYYDLLDIPRSASAADIIQAYRLATRTYVNGSQATYSMFDEDQLVEIRRDIEEAYNTLSHTERRKLYDTMLAQQQAGTTSRNAIDEREKNVFYLKQPAEIPAATGIKFTGDQLKRIRKSRGISLAKLADATGIQQRLLQAIEEEDLTLFRDKSELNTTLSCYSKETGLDPQEVRSSYPLTDQA
ncbi:helix-turn-helix domain-containing protein [Mariprofundus sp. KV]|uniref:helix-turn-helix domain-containing protein n=1 Tax=Mariprofundus sp. KV TaxID=2608715 RepID=UPI0015A48CC7|nr:helix-turn-helix domain-containing protein [Mariprofundus sp. KV]NWF35601.1 DnaJ domain-containing protein [Mariprofundus sp. KV]